MREHARQVLLLAEGQMQEYTPSDVFFSAPLSEAGRHFLGTGWAGLPGVGRATLPLGQPFGPVPEELGLRSVACGGRLRAVLGDRIFVHDLQRTQGMSRSDAAALTGAGIRTVAIFSPQSASEALALLAYGLTSLKLPLPSPTDALPALRARCSTLQEALASQGPLVFLRRPEDRQVGFTVALFLVSLGIRADLAAEMAAEIDGAEQPDPAAESRLLDLELSLTLERDSPDPNGFAAPPRETARPDRQAHTRRGTSG
jgi:hypothetical protein